MKKQLHIISGKSWHDEQIPAIIDHLWNVCGQMEVGALLTCGSGITYFIPDWQVNNAPTSIWPHTFHKWSIMVGICSLFQLFPEKICSCFFIISHRRDLEFSSSSIWKRKKWSDKNFGAEQTWTGDHSLKNLQSIHLGYLQVDECSWKNTRWNHFGDRHWLPVPALRLQAFASHRHKAFVSCFSSRERVVSELILLG